MQPVSTTALVIRSLLLMYVPDRRRRSITWRDQLIQRLANGDSTDAVGVAQFGFGRQKGPGLHLQGLDRHQHVVRDAALEWRRTAAKSGSRPVAVRVERRSCHDNHDDGRRDRLSSLDHRLRHSLGDSPVVGLDAHPEMLAVARGKPFPVEWVDGRAEALPFPDASFDAVVIQCGMMFFEIAQVLCARCTGCCAPEADWQWRCAMPSSIREATGR